MKFLLLLTPLFAATGVAVIVSTAVAFVIMVAAVGVGAVAALTHDPLVVRSRR